MLFAGRCSYCSADFGSRASAARSVSHQLKNLTTRIRDLCYRDHGRCPCVLGVGTLNLTVTASPFYRLGLKLIQAVSAPYPALRLANSTTERGSLRGPSVCCGQRVQVPNGLGLWCQTPLRLCFWGYGYLDPLLQDSTPMFVDPDFVRRTWKAMVEAHRQLSVGAVQLQGPNQLSSS